MKKMYSTGQFAKLANISERTIRYYDKIGLLKPSFVMENGYRKYSNEDLMKLQRILFFKAMGFSLEEIEGMIVENDIAAIKKSLQMQIELINAKIQTFSKLKDSLISATMLLENNKLNDNKIIELLNISGNMEKIIENYQNANNLSVRIRLHKLFSVNKNGWFPWLYENIEFNKINKVLEIGCGDGELWMNNNHDLRNREVFLSDISEGMLNAAKKRLGEDFNYMIIDCHNIPFKKEYFDAVIANHVLFYLYDLNKGLSEITRILKNKGILYCSTYGKEHMIEVTELVHEFDPNIKLSNNHLYDIFGLDNGKRILDSYFSKVELIRYEDYLEVDDYKPLFDYIISCHGNQIECLQGRMNEFRLFLENKITENRSIHITKQAGLFICKK